MAKSGKNQRNQTTAAISEFCAIVGETDRNRIIEFFLEGRELDFAATYLAEELDIGKTTCYAIISDLVGNQLLIPSRMVGNTQLYRLANNSRVKLLLSFFDKIMQE